MGDVVELKTKKLIKKVENAEYWMEKYYEEIAYKQRYEDLHVTYTRKCWDLNMLEFELERMSLWDRIFHWPY